MNYLTDFRIPALALIMAISSFTIFVTEFLQNNLISSQNEKIKSEAQRDLAVVRSNLEAQIYSDIYYSNSLATLASVNPDSTTAQWEQIAKKLFSKSRNLRNIGIAPNDIIEFVYPVEGNEAALGLDFRTVPGQWKSIQRSRDTKSILLAGPVNLVQGGLGLIARNPIFTDPPYNTQYWGSCSAVIDMNALFASSGITQLERKYHFAMRGVDGGGKNGAFFYGDEAVFGNEIASDSVSLLSGSWYMAVSGEGLSLSLPWYQLYSPRLIGYPTLIVIILLFSIIYFLYKVAHTHSLQDELTKLPNRRLLMHSLEQVMQDPFPRARHFTLLNLDLNKFKAVNDTFGHSVGDAVLVEVAKRIKKTVRTSDLTARVGGDEFLIYLPKLTDENSVLRIIHALRAEIGGKPINAEGHSITLEASIGYTINLNSEANVDAILHAADINMYADKSRQKNNP